MDIIFKYAHSYNIKKKKDSCICCFSTEIWICGLLEAELHICVYVGKKQINNCLGLIYSLPWPDTQTANQGTREIPVVRFQIESSLLFAYAHKRGRCFFVLPVIFGFEP